MRWRTAGGQSGAGVVVSTLPLAPERAALRQFGGGDGPATGPLPGGTSGRSSVTSQDPRDVVPVRTQK